MGLAAVLLAGLVAVHKIEGRAFAMTLADTRPLVQVAAALLVIPFALNGFAVLRAVRRHPRWTAWGASLHFAGWIAPALSIAAILVLLAVDTSNLFPGASGDGKARVVESVIPLVMGVQAALIFSPGDEDAIEVIAACPRPLVWTLLERVAVVAGLLSAVGFGGAIVSLVVLDAPDVPLTLVRWLPPGLLLAGAGVFTTIASRSAVFGATVIALLWAVTLLLGFGLMPGKPLPSPLHYAQPFLWSVHPYVQPEWVEGGDYWLNRAFLVLAGVALVSLAVDRLRREII